MNDLSLSTLGWLASGSVACALVLGCLCAWRNPVLQAALALHCAALDFELRCLQSSLGARRVLSLQLGSCAATIVLAALSASPWPLSFLLGVALVPPRLIRRLRRQRSAKIEAQLDVWLLALSNQLRANPALGDALRESSRLVPAPLSAELSLVHKETLLGMPLDRALTEMAARVQSPLCNAALVSLRIARNSGGELSATLESAAASLREMARLEGVVRARTAEGRAQSFLIGVLPAPLMLLLHALDAQLFVPLLTKPLGHAVIALACMIWLCAVLWAQRIVAVDI